MTNLSRLNQTFGLKNILKELLENWQKIRNFADICYYVIFLLFEDPTVLG
jgi:hypothetical protein